jgi:hypothetical protein
MNLNDNVVYRCRRLGPLGQLHPGRSRRLVRYHNRLHRPPPCVVKLGQRVPLSNLSTPPKCRSAPPLMVVRQPFSRSTDWWQLSPGLLRVDPSWVPLRADPRFRKLAELGRE